MPVAAPSKSNIATAKSMRLFVRRKCIRSAQEKQPASIRTRYCNAASNESHSQGLGEGAPHPVMSREH
jgi:hypothetical protein